MLTWAVRFFHRRAPAESEEAVSAIADIINRPCFASCTRLSWCRGDRFGGHITKAPEVVRKYLLDPQNEAIRLDNGRTNALAASMEIGTNDIRRTGLPLQAFIIVPLTDDTSSLEEAACDLAGTLRASVGAMSVWPDYDWASRFVHTSSLTEEQARSIGFSARRHREWRILARSQVQIDTEIPGPEWGLFLGPGHLAMLPAATLRTSGVFAEVRDLGEERTFLRMTEQPRDALVPDFEARLDRARGVLEPILADLGRLD